MPTLNPSFLTPLHVIRALQAGSRVPLEAPGWGDTERKTCPDCGKSVMGFKSGDHAGTLFVYGMATAQPHRCGKPLDAEDHPHWLQLQAAQAELNQLQAWNEWTEVMRKRG
jgi:hypothetical protein